MPPRPLRIFISYCKADEKLLRRLEQHLSVLARGGHIEIWSDLQLKAGEDRWPAVKEALARADAALLLLSPDYLAAPSVHEQEMPLLLEEQRHRGLWLYPIVLRPCLWDSLDALRGLQPLPPGGRALSQLDSKKVDDAFKEIAKAVAGMSHRLEGLHFEAPCPPGDVLHDSPPSDVLHRFRRLAVRLGLGAAALATALALLRGPQTILNRLRYGPPDGQLQAALARQLHTEAEQIVLNLPARAGRYPGAVLIHPRQSKGELLVRAGERPANLPPEAAPLRAIALPGAVATQLASTIGGAEPAEAADVQVELRDLRVLERPLPELAEFLRTDEDLARARESRQPLLVVTRAYEATPAFLVRPGALDTASWARLRDELLARGGAPRAGGVALQGGAPQVVAYETAEAHFVASSFGGGDSRLELRPAPAYPVTSALPRAEDLGERASGQGVAFAAVASSRYGAATAGDLPAAVPSAALWAEVMRGFGAQELPTGLAGTGYLDERPFAEARGRLRERVRALHPRAFVFYYVGHAISGTDGAQHLVLADYRGDLRKDVAARSALSAPGDDTSPLSSGNLRDLAKVMGQVAERPPEHVPGLLSVQELYREFAETGVPFALVIDGCYPAGALARLREELKLTPFGDYYGQSEVPYGELARYFRALDQFGQAPHLRATNPVVMAVKPGALALAVRHPLFMGDLAPQVGQLAARAARLVPVVLLQREEVSLGAWLRLLVDYTGVGEKSLRGSVAWSDFSVLKAVPLLAFP